MDALRDWWDRTNVPPLQYPVQVFGVKPENKAALDAALSELYVWTYREAFAPLPRSSLCSDKGWGCLIRTGQMLLARALQKHGAFVPAMFRDVADDDAAPFSIHAFVRAVADPKKAFTDKFWSPSQCCEAIRATVARAPLEKRLSVYKADCGCIYEDEVMFQLKQSPLFILAPVLTSTAKTITQQVFVILDLLLRLPNVVGVVGGTPKRSYFVVGASGQRLLYLDPHVRTQPAFVDAKSIGMHHETADTLQSTEWKRLDPSLLIGFYVADAEDFARMTKELRQMTLGLDAECNFIHVEASRASAKGCEAVATWDDDE